MQRNLEKLEQATFDLVIIGGGITGACLAADAALRGLSVALVEKSDFGAATSSASSKLLHGGIRYLQQLNFAKVRESAKERMYFQQLAPHLTYYIPFIIPTYKKFSKSKLVMKAAMVLYQATCTGQDRILSDPSKKLPTSHFLSRQEVIDAVPDLEPDEITGGVVFYECHMFSSERMTLAFLETAHRHGANIANYLAVESFLEARKGCISGVKVRDLLGGDAFDIRARLVVNAAGPWIPLLNHNIGQEKNVEGVVNAYSKGAHIITRQLTQRHAVALPTQKQNQAVINRGGRHVFIIPWRGYSLIGTTYKSYDGALDDICATEIDIDEMLSDINSAMGKDVLQREDVLHAYVGIYPLIDDVINTNVYQGTGEYQIIDHAETDSLDGLVSVFGAKFTTARLLAEKALDKITPRLNKPSGPCATRNARLNSGNIDDIAFFRSEQCARYSAILPDKIIINLVTNYGTDIHRVMSLIESDNTLAQELLPGRLVVAAEVIYSVRNEMACHLDDFIFRRTGLGTLGNPGKEVLQYCANLMGEELGWSQHRKNKEVAQTLKAFPANGHSS